MRWFCGMPTAGSAPCRWGRCGAPDATGSDASECLNQVPLGGIVPGVENEHDGCHAQHGYTADKQAYLRRLRLIEGQARGIARMVEQDEYCIDIMTQISAVTSALKAVSMALLKDHLEHCVAAAVREGGDAAQEKFDEAMTAISRLAR